MAYLDLAPAITTIRSRLEDFEFSNNTLHHLSSRHRFRFSSDGDVQVDAACDCSMLRISREQGKAFHAAYREWYATYWRPIEINREFASHFRRPNLAQRVLRRLMARIRRSVLDPTLDQENPASSVGRIPVHI